MVFAGCLVNLRNFNPRFPRGKRRLKHRITFAECVISIHASRGGSDFSFSSIFLTSFAFQSTLPAGEATSSNGRRHSFGIFQSTLPAGEATVIVPDRVGQYQFQSTLPAGEATPFHHPHEQLAHISIHASRGGSDLALTTSLAAIVHFNPRFPRGKRPFPPGVLERQYRFQSTLPAGEATFDPFNKA